MRQVSCELSYIRILRIRTDARQLHRPGSAYYASNANANKEETYQLTQQCSSAITSKALITTLISDYRVSSVKKRKCTVAELEKNYFKYFID